MTQLIILVLLSAVVWWQFGRWLAADQVSPEMNRRQTRIRRLWNRAIQNMRTNKLLAAEKDLLSILRIDNKHAPAYNRIGILYAKQREYRDAIRCFEIARTIQPSSSSLHNLGVIHYETGNYEKAELAFAQALAMDETSASRHLNYAKVLAQQNRLEDITPVLEKAAGLEPTKETYKILLKHYRQRDLTEKATELEAKLKTMIITAADPGYLKRSDKIVII